MPVYRRYTNRDGKQIGPYISPEFETEIRNYYLHNTRGENWRFDPTYNLWKRK